MNPSPSISANLSAMSDTEGMQHFERSALPHLDGAYNLARWLTHDDHGAEDGVQEAYLRARRHFGGFHGDDVRPWLLQIVRHAGHSWLKENRALDEVEDVCMLGAPPSDEPPAVAAGEADKEQINAAIASLPVVFREVLVLRELEDLSYDDIARIVEVSVGTVMLRLSRARGLMRVTLTRPLASRHRTSRLLRQLP